MELIQLCDIMTTSWQPRDPGMDLGIWAHQDQHGGDEQQGAGVGQSGHTLRYAG